jgi:transporter family-2 protein
MPRPVLPSSLWVASTKPEGRVIAGQKPTCIAGWGTRPPRSWQGNEHTAPKSGWRIALAFVLLAVAAGGALPFQAGINARLATFIGGPIRASAISFALGTVVLVLLALVATRGVVSTGRLGSVPWWGWLGGAVGAGYVASTVAAAPRLGALNLFAAVIFGQLLCSVMLDHFGVLYREHSLSAGRLGGVVLLAAGVALVRFF